MTDASPDTRPVVVDVEMSEVPADNIIVALRPGGTPQWLASRLARVGPFLLPFAAIIALLQMAEGGADALSPFLAGVIAATLPAGLAEVLSRRAWRRIAQERSYAPLRAGPTRITVGPGGLEMIHSTYLNRISWAAVTGVRDVARHTVLVLDPLTVVAIPHALLPDGIDPEGFRARIEAWRRDAPGQTDD